MKNICLLIQMMSAAENNDIFMLLWMLLLLTMMMVNMNIIGRCYLLNIGYTGRYIYITPWLATLPLLLLSHCDYADSTPPTQIHAQSGPKYGQISMAVAIVHPLFAPNCHIYGTKYASFSSKVRRTNACGGGFIPVFRWLHIRMQAWVIPGMFEQMNWAEGKKSKRYFIVSMMFLNQWFLGISYHAPLNIK